MLQVHLKLDIRESWDIHLEQIFIIYVCIIYVCVYIYVLYVVYVCIIYVCIYMYYMLYIM